MTTYSDIDMTTSGACSAKEVGAGSTVSMQIINKSGSHTNHSVCLEGSLNGTNWIEIGRVSSGREGIGNALLYGMSSVRYTKNDLEPTSAKCDIIILTK